MNRKEIEVEAEKYGIENYESCIYDDVKGWETDIKAREQSFKDGAEFVYKEIARLEEDVEYWKNEYYYLETNPEEA